MITEILLDRVLGPGSSPDPLVRARTSNKRFVRSLHQLAEYSPKATGRVLTAYEALIAFGLDKLAEATEWGSAVIGSDPNEPSVTFKRRREALGLTASVVARATGLPEIAIHRADESAMDVPLRDLEKLAEALGLDERLIAVSHGAGGSDQLAARLRSLHAEQPAFTPAAVAVFAEAAWVIRTQARLYTELGLVPSVTFEPSANYGEPNYPAWRHGYFLAAQARQALGLGGEPIHSLRSLCSELCIPVVLASLPRQFAGATIDTGSVRGIVVNTAGYNRNVWTRRFTVAHELGHMLWDPTESLRLVRVDPYDHLEREPSGLPDYVEARANAFAIEFLAPGSAVEDEYRRYPTPASGLQQVMLEFGVSFTAAKHHVRNLLGIGPGVSFDNVSAEPTDEWKGRESFTDDYFPLATPQSRKGEFAGLVVAAEREGVISEDTAASYLKVDVTDYVNARDIVQEIFPVKPRQIA